MQELTSNEILWLALTFGVGVILIGFALWWRSSGSSLFSYHQHPLTKILDETKEPLSVDDIKRAVFGVDINASKEDQASKFKRDLKQNS